MKHTEGHVDVPDLMGFAGVEFPEERADCVYTSAQMLITQSEMTGLFVPYLGDWRQQGVKEHD